jgi:hypothetical protein
MEATQENQNHIQVSKTGKFEEVFKKPPRIYRSSGDPSKNVKVSVQRSKETISVKAIQQ